MDIKRRRAGVLLTATAFDLAFGEPPARLHPVVWLGRSIAALARRPPADGRLRQTAWGGAMAAGGPAVAALAGWCIERAGRRLGSAGILAEAWALKSAFAARALIAAGRDVRLALQAGEDERARALLVSLVSRETDALRPALVAAAAIESLAENTTDSLLAPWLAYALAGLPGAFAYRAINTLDSMIGYHGRYEYLGKSAARLDDLVNLLPARLAAALLALAAPAGRGSIVGAVRAARRDHGRTASPNAGWTMAAMAGALGVRLEKLGAYVLGDGREPGPRDIGRAERIVMAAAGLGLGLTVVGGAASPRSRFVGIGRRKTTARTGTLPRAASRRDCARTTATAGTAGPSYPWASVPHEPRSPGTPV